MAIQVRKLLQALVVFCAFAALSPRAAEQKPSIPSHTLDAIRLAISSGQAMVVARVVDVSEDSGTATFEIEQMLMGQVDTPLQLPSNAFYAGDLATGTRMIVPLKRGADQGWVPTDRYELVADGKIRDIPLDAFLTRLVREIAVRSPEQRVNQKTGEQQVAAKKAPEAPQTAKQVSAPSASVTP